MMSRLLSAILFLSLSFPVIGQNIQTRYAEYGEAIVTQLSSTPFPHAARDSGHTYYGRFFPAEEHYKDSSVMIFIPKGFKKSNSTDFVIHFHGWYNNIDSTLRQYRLIEQFSESNKNAIFIVPEGPKDAPDSFGGKLEDKEGFKKFIKEIAGFLSRSKKIKNNLIGSVVLSGHSGGYHVISYILMRGGMPDKIKEVYLLDALYGQTEKYVYWFNRYKGKIINIYTDGGGTKDETELLMEDLDGWKIPYLAKKDEDVTATELANNRLIFLHTSMTHNDVVMKNNNFREYVKASGLKNIGTKVKSKKVER
jgi:hypothetical protein